MTIRTKSAFYYVPEITETNFALNFIEPNEDNLELTAELDVGSYTLTDLASEVQSKLNQVGKNTYTVITDRDTRIYTISADGDFNLLVTTGSNAGQSAFGIIGFLTDQTGAATYDSEQAVGIEYLPQLEFQDYKDKLDNVENIESSVNSSATGKVEVVSFGSVSFYEFNIKYIKNSLNKSEFLDYRPNAVQEARDFLTFAIGKEDIEFMPDRTDRSIFDKVLLESTRASRDGTAFELQELTSQGLDGYFETGRLRFRVLD